MRLLSIIAAALLICSFVPASGFQWEIQRTDELIGISLLGISAWDQNNIWAVGTRDCGISGACSSIVIYSGDGGETWEVQFTGSPSGLADDICFVSELVGWANLGMDSARLLHTENGGARWYWQPLGYSVARIWAIDFLSPSVGFVACEMADVPGGDRLSSSTLRLLRTDDGGTSWNLLPSNGLPPGGFETLITSMDFADQLSGWLAIDLPGPYAAIYATQDGGTTWTLQLQRSDSQEYTINDVQFVDPFQGWAAGFGHDVGIEIFTTDDGGLNWSTHQLGIPLGPQEIEFAGPGSGWILTYIPFGRAPYILRTTDNWQTWDLQVLPGTGMYGDSFDFINGEMGWVVGGGGLVLRTFDSGYSWQVLRWSDTFIDVDFVSESVGWAVGDYGCILHTTTGGLYWEYQYYNGRFPERIRCASFLNGEVGWLVALDEGNHVLLNTGDGGMSWELVTILPWSWRWMPLCLHFFDEQRGLLGVITDSPGVPESILYRTTDGGITWHEVVVDTLGDGVKDLDVFGDQYVWALASRDRIWVSADTGQTWQSFEIDPFGTMIGEPVAVDFVNQNEGWVVCASSDSWAVYHSVDGGQTWTMQGLPDILNPTPKDIAFANPDTGWISQWGNPLVYTENGGEEWKFYTKQENPYLKYIWAMGFPGWNYGYGVGLAIFRLDLRPGAGVEEKQSLPADQDLSLVAAPNPLLTGTNLQFSSTGMGKLTLEIYDVHGRKVRTLLEDVRVACQHKIFWDGRGDKAEPLPSGIYFARLTQSDRSVTRKIVLLR